MSLWGSLATTMCLCECLPHVYECLWKQEEASDALEVLQAVVSQPSDLGAENQPVASGAVSALNH